jgi:hypothetical protein
VSPGGRSPVPESVRVAFHSFADITNSGSYTAPDVRLLPGVKAQRSNVPRFNFKEWWIIEEGGALEEPFDIRDEIGSGLLGALQTVPVCLDIRSPLTNQGLQQEASAQLRASLLEKFKRVKAMQSDITDHLLPIKEELQAALDYVHQQLSFWDGSLTWDENLRKMQGPSHLA